MPDEIIRAIDIGTDLPDSSLSQLISAGISCDPSPGWYRRRLSGVTGNMLPVLEAIDQRNGIAATFRLCDGLDSWCAKQCPMNDPNLYRDRCCPVESQQAWDIIVGLAHEAGVTLMEQTGQTLDLVSILREIGSMDLIKEYVGWALVSWRSQVLLARDGLVVENKTYHGKSVTIEQKEHPGVGVAAKATDIKLKILKEFMATKRGRMDARAKEATTVSVYGELFRTINEARKAREEN